MSGEHIYSDWINKVLGGKRTYNFRRVGHDGSTLNQWSSRELDLTAKVVCEECNVGWMSDIEHKHAKPAFAPIILGSPVSLLPLGIHSAAVWAFKIAVLADHLQSTRAPFFTEVTRTNFRLRQKIPYGVQVWLAAFHDPGTRNGLFNAHYLKLRDGRYRGFEYLVVTYGIAPLLIQLTAPRWGNQSKRRVQIPQLIQTRTGIRLQSPSGQTSVLALRGLHRTISGTK
jgi:hypothetical protein